MRLNPCLSVVSAMLLLTMMGCRSEAPSDKESAADPAPTAEAVKQDPVAAPAPAAPAPLCTLSGAGGEVVSCPLNLTVSGIRPAGLQFRIDWDPKAMVWRGIRSQRCTPNGKCKSVMSPPNTTVGPHGHSLVTNSGKTTQDAGNLTLMIVHPSKADVPLDDEIGEILFMLRRPILERDASSITISEVVATSPDAMGLPARIEESRIHIGP